MTARTAAKKKPTPKHRPSEIAPGVFVGGWDDAVAFSGARYCVLDELPKEAPADEGIPIYDEGHDAPIVPNLDRVAKLMKSARERDEPVLVFCGHGVRRSPLAAAWYLRVSEGLTLDAAYARVRAVRPKVEHAKEWIRHWEVLESTPAGSREKPRA